MVMIVRHIHTVDEHVLHVLERLSSRLDLIVMNLGTIERFNTMSAALQASIDQLKSDVTDLTTSVGSAEAMITGLAQQLADAIAAAQAAGATPQQLQDLTDLHSALAADTAGLAAAVAANTPASPPPSPPPVDTTGGGAGNDTITGGQGTDTTTGGQGTDTTTGGQGTDTTAGGQGTDTLAGGQA